MATVNLASNMTLGVYTSAGVAVTNNRITVPLTWTGLNGYPEVVVEQAVSDTDAAYHPCRVIEAYGMETPVKLRLSIEDGENLIFVDGIYGGTPYARIKVYASDATTGVITYSLEVA